MGMDVGCSSSAQYRGVEGIYWGTHARDMGGMGSRNVGKVWSATPADTTALMWKSHACLIDTFVQYIPVHYRYTSTHRSSVMEGIPV